MEQELAVQKLRNVDKELHLIIEGLKPKKKKALTLEELRESFRKDLISDEDPTELIRQMRDKEYGL